MSNSTEILDDTPESAYELSLSLPVTRVLAYEDRADVTREGSVRLPEGSCTLLLQGVSPLVVADRLVALVEAEDPQAAPTVVEDVEILHRYERITQESEDHLRALQEKCEAANRDADDASAALERKQTERLHMLKMQRAYLERVSQTTWAGEGDRAVWERDFSTLRERLQAIDVDIDLLRGQEARARDTAMRNLALIRRGERAELRLVADVKLHLSGGGGSAKVTLKTVLPCALWRPAHEAEFCDGVIRWRVFGTVWQSTGEDWHDVELAFSTRRPSAGAQLPALSADWLRPRKKTEEERKTIRVQHRSEEVTRGDDDGGVPGVYDGGEVREFVPTERLTVPSNGRPHRVQVAAFESPATLDRACFPDESGRVYLRAKLRCELDQPLLAGPVTLMREGAWVGVGDVRYVGARESFELAFGTDDRFVVKRRRKRAVEKRTLAKDRTHFVTEVELSSSAPTPEQVEVQLRLPISELKQLKVVLSEAHCSGGVPKLDDSGFARWPVALGPGERKTIQVGFYFDATSAVQVPDPW